MLTRLIVHISWTFFWACSGLQAAIVTSPTTDWMPISYRDAVPDAAADNQANIADLELIGDLSNPAFYTQFDDSGPASTTDGTVAFRMRMSGNQGNPRFFGNAWVGLDPNRDGSLDLFLGVTESEIGIFSLQGGSSSSPKGTKINKQPLWSQATDSLNFSWTPVTSQLDPTATSLDLDNEAGNDYFLSFALPFQEIVNAVTSLGIVSDFDDTSTLNLIAATSTQGNNLNSDINGISGGIDSDAPWSDSDAFTEESGIDGTAIPEPATMALLSGAVVFLALLLRRRFRS